MNSKTKSLFSLIILVVVIAAMVLVAISGVGENGFLGAKNINLGLDLKGGAYVVFEAAKEDPTDNEMSSALALIQERLTRKGYTEAEAAKQGSNRIRVDMPGVENVEEAVNQIGQTAQLTFRNEAGEIVLSGEHIKNAEKQVGSVDGTSAVEPYVLLEFDEEGKKIFAEVTEKNIGKRIGIYLDEAELQSPVVSTSITDGFAIISGGFTATSSEETAALIRAGSLPFKLNIIDRNEIGARLGADALSTSMLAGVIGVALVFVFMLVVYRLLGVAADLALLIYISLEIMILSLFNLTLTLPGIAGIVLSVGMAVDANVIIFERTKEELLLGKTLKASINSGYKKAFSAIIDGNVTTLIAAAVLFWLGTGTIKGFAQTLAIGIVLSMFTALVVTKFISTNIANLGARNLKLYGVKHGEEAQK